MSLATDRYCRPATNLGEAILRVTVSKDAEHFILEVFDYTKETINGVEFDKPIPPRSTEAYNFIRNRFKHGCRPLTRKDVYHPIYEVPISDYTIALIQQGWTGKRIISDVAKPFYTRIFLRELKAQTNVTRTAEFKVNGKVPSEPWFEQHDKFLHDTGLEYYGDPIVLSPYQKTAAFNACKSSSYGLLCDPGTGKTAMMLRKLDYIIAHSSTGTMTLICCPKSVRSNWVNEITKFSQYGPHGENKIHIHIITGGNATQRFVNFVQDISTNAVDKHIVVISNYESFVETPKLHDLEWNYLAFDESHNLANPSTKRTKTFMELSSKFQNVVIASGTFFRNTPFDGYGQMEVMGKGLSGFTSFNSFKNFYGEYAKAANGMVTQTGFNPETIPLLKEKLAKHCFMISKEEALPNLPPKRFNILECNLTKEQMKVYMDLCSVLQAEIAGYGDEPDSMTVNNILTQMLRLAQITSGYAQMDSGMVNRFDPNPKLELLRNCLLGDPDFETDGCLTDKNNKAIVWCAFVENLAMVKARLELEGIRCVTYSGNTKDKDTVTTQFNCDPTTRVFVGIAKSGGVGLNLVGFDPYNPSKYTTNTTNVFYYSSDWSSVNRLQAADRAHRHNTRVPVQITDLVVPNSIDTEIYARVQSKIEMSIGMRDIRKILNSLVPSYNGD